MTQVTTKHVLNKRVAVYYISDRRMEYITSVRLPAELYSKVKAESERTGIPPATIIRSCIHQVLGGDNGPEQNL